MKKLYYLILNYNDYHTTKKCIDYIQYYSVINKIVIVDNCSTDDSFIQLKKLENHKIIVVKSNRNGGYGYGNNYGIEFIKKNYGNDCIIAISNPDVIINEKDILICLEKQNRLSNCVVISPIMLDSNNNICYDCAWNLPSYYEYLFFSLTLLGLLFSYEIIINKESLVKDVIKCDCVAGSFFIVDLSRLNKEFTLFDNNIFLYCEETVLGHKIKKIKKDVYLCTEASFVHQHSVSINKSISSVFRQRALMWESRLYVLNNYYNSNSFRKILSYIVKRIALLEFRLLMYIKK